MGVCGILLSLLHSFGPGYELEQRTVDSRLALRPKTPAPPDVGLVAIGDDDVAIPKLGPWPFSRAIHADIVTILRELEAKTIIFDVLFSDPADPAADDALETTLAERDDVVLAYHFNQLLTSDNVDEPPGEKHFLQGNRFGLDVASIDPLRGIDPQPLCRSFDAQFGAVNVMADAGNSVIRSVPMFIEHDGMLYPGLALQALVSTLAIKEDQIRIDPGRCITLVDTPRGNLRIPVDRHLRYRINFTSGTENFDRAFQYKDIYLAVQDHAHAEAVRAAISGRPVIIGNASTGTSDIVTTPIGRLPGLIAQATVIANVLTQDYLKFLSPWQSALWCCAFGMLLSLAIRPRFPWATVASITVFGFAYLLIAYLSARSNWMIPLLPVLELAAIALVGKLSLQVICSQSETERTLRVLRRYVSPAVASRALMAESLTSEPTERREITVFFSDIRGFTSWSERREPEEVTAVLNDYLEAMVQIVGNHGGTLDKFVGDSVMCLFNAPEPIEGHPQAAVRMALEMQKRIAQLNVEWVAAGREAIGVGMGINSGFATVGNFGSTLYSDYTAIGNSVNLAARLESACLPGQILISASCETLTSAITESRFHGELELKGIGSQVPVFEVLSVDGEANPHAAR
jgi:adenylate cyclase